MVETGSKFLRRVANRRNSFVYRIGFPAASPMQKQAGGNALVKDLVQTFRQQYKLRRTMMEELDKLVL